MKNPSCVKLSTLTREPDVKPFDASGVHSTLAMHPREGVHPKDHLLCLNQQEALMLFGLLQAVSRHEPTRQTMLSCGDYKHFHRELCQALAQSLAG